MKIEEMSTGDLQQEVRALRSQNAVLRGTVETHNLTPEGGLQAPTGTEGTFETPGDWYKESTLIKITNSVEAMRRHGGHPNKAVSENNIVEGV